MHSDKKNMANYKERRVDPSVIKSCSIMENRSPGYELITVVEVHNEPPESKRQKTNI